MSIYVGFFDCSATQCELAVTNIMSRPAAYRMRVFNRAGASLADHERTLAAHASERVGLNDLAVGEEGQILIAPVDDEDDEFPAMLIVADPKAEAGAPNRFLPLMRIEEMPDEDEEDEEDEDEEEEGEEEDGEEEEGEEEEEENKKKSKKGKQHDE
jgi:hypothetical protein